MGPGERRAKAMAGIEMARNAIVEVAAKLTAAGVDTSGFAEPVARLQEALTELGALDREEAGRRVGKVEAVREEIQTLREGN
jgi:hypothetical protein